MFTSENDVENGLDNHTNRAGGLGAEDCLAAAEHFAISCTDTRKAPDDEPPSAALARSAADTTAFTDTLKVTADEPPSTPL